MVSLYQTEQSAGYAFVAAFMVVFQQMVQDLILLRYGMLWVCLVAAVELSCVLVHDTQEKAELYIS